MITELAGVNEGDTVKFTIKIINTGADVITLDSNYTDVMYNGFNVPITPPSLVLESQTGNNVNTAQPYVLNVGEVETHIMEHSITTGDINSGGIYNSISFIGNSERNPDTSRPDLGDLSDDPNTPEVDDPAFVPLSADTDGDGIPDTLDLDDDNDGILDEIEACFSFSLDGDSFDNYTGNNYYPDNSMDKFQEPSIAPPFSSVNSDGEIWSGTNLYQPYVDSQGKNYGKFIQLLQGAGENDLSYWDESSHDATTSFDRIVVIENVTPNTDYTVSFVQRAGVIYFDVNGGYQPGGETLLQLQSMNSDFEISQTFTPGSSWSEESFNFTTDSETTQLAILFSAYDADNPVSIHLDAIVFDYQESCNGDIDEDGVPNHLDLDSDNDGIYDVVEAGFEAIDTNLDGMLDFNDSAFVDTDFDTVHDPVFGATMIDSDGDGVIDAFQLDSDGDGCFDTGEAGYTDSALVADRDGILGDAPYTVDSFGKINSGTDGYTVPLDFDNNGILDYREDEYDAGCFNPSMLVTKTATITQNDGNTTVDVGDVINYEITVVNNSLEPLKDIVVKDTLSNQALSFELQTTYVEELNTGNHEEGELSITSLGNTSNPNNYTIGAARQTGNDMQADSNNGSYWNDFSSSNACGLCGYFKIWHPNPSSVGSIQSPSGTNVRLNFSQRNNSTGVMSTETFTLDGVTYTVTHGWAVQGIYRIDIDSSDPDKEFKVSTYNQNTYNYGHYQYHKTRSTDWGTIRYYHNDSGYSASHDMYFYFIPKSPEVSQRVNGEYTKSSNNFTYNDTDNDTSNPHYETWRQGNYYHYTTTTLYKQGAIIYYAVRYDVTDWVEADLQGADQTTMEFGVLKQDNTAVYTAQHTVTQADIDAGDLLSNQVTVTATMVKPETSVSVGDITITETLENPVETPLNSTSSIDVTKVADVSDKDGDGYTNTGDEVTFTIDITNTGTQTITGLDIQDTLSDTNGDLISNPELSQVPINTNYVYHSDHLSEIHRSNGLSSSGTIDYNYPENISVYVDPSNTHYGKGVGLISTGKGYSDWGPLTGTARVHGLILDRVNAINIEDHIFFNSSTGNDLNNGGYKLEPNTTYTLSVYARKPTASDEDSNFNLFAYDGNAQITHGSTDDIINNSFKSDNLIVDSDQFKRYQFTFTTSNVTYDSSNSTDVDGNSNVGTIAHPRFGIVYPKAISDPTTGKINIWGLQLEKSPRATTYVLNDGTDNYDNPKGKVNIAEGSSYVLEWHGSTYQNPSSNPNISLGLNSNRNFKGKSLARASTDKSPAIIEYPGIINSLDGGQSKDDLIPGSWINSKFNSDDATDSNSYIYLDLYDDKLYSNNGESVHMMGYEIPYADIGSNNYSIRGTNYRYASYNNGNRNASYFTTWAWSSWSQDYRWQFDQWYNVLLDRGSYHNTDNPFFVQFENTT